MLLTNESVKEIEERLAEILQKYGKRCSLPDPLMLESVIHSIMSLFGENSQAEREVIDAQASNSPDRVSKTVADLEAELAALREQLECFRTSNVFLQKQIAEMVPLCEPMPATPDGSKE